MRQITTHRNAQPQPMVAAFDTPGYGGSTVRYEISGFNTAYNELALDPNGRSTFITRTPIILHHTGLRASNTLNGVTPEALIACSVDHLAAEARTPQYTPELQLAVEYLNSAMVALANHRQATVQGNYVDQSYGSYGYGHQAAVSAL